MSKTKIIDIHHHLFPKGFKPHPWSVEKDYKDMKNIGVDRVVLSCVLPVTSDNAKEINDYIAECVNYDPSFYYGLAAIPLDNIDYAIKEIERCKNKLKLVGYTMISHNNGIYISDDRIEPILEKLDEINAVVFLHPSPKRAKGNDIRLTGADDSAYEYTFETTRSMMDYIYKDKNIKYPNIKWVLSHAGGTIPYLSYRVSHAYKWRAARQDEKCILSQLKNLYYDLALSNDPLVYRLLKDFCGPDHIVFGSDYPAHKPFDINDDVETFINSDIFSDEEKMMIGNKTVEELFGKRNEYE